MSTPDATRTCIRCQKRTLFVFDEQSGAVRRVGFDLQEIGKAVPARLCSKQCLLNWILLDPAGLKITVAHCVHCERLVIAPDTDECVCGAELYPVSKWVKLAVPTQVDDMKGA